MNNFESCNIGIPFMNTASNPSDFEQLYLEVRRRERRVYSDEEVVQLPYLPAQSAHAREWRIRAKSWKRFQTYLQKLPPSYRLLEIGCGNGWFSNACSQHLKEVVGIDLNHTELEQARRLFSKESLQFHHWDLFSPPPFESAFNIIVLNAVIQYFPDVTLLMKRLKELLASKGEIHIIDSPFYPPSELSRAKERSRQYYQKMGVEGMAEHYFHHEICLLKDFEVLYTPPGKLKKLLKDSDSPFSWYCWRATDSNASDKQK
jgi:SAM-dependent methyltransferase